MDDEVLFRFVTGRATPAEAAAIDAWRAASPHNEAVFRQVSRLLTLTAEADARLPARPVPLAAEIIGRAEVLSSPARVPPRTWSGSLGRTAPWPAYAAAALVLSLLSATLWHVWVSPSGMDLPMQEVATGAGEAATVALADGSVIHLGARSRLRIGPAQPREVFLDGHAYFAVAKQKQRPLIIRTPAGDVKVVGTRFDLEATSAQLRLVVLEGRVLLSNGGPETAVNAGQQARIVEGMRLPVVAIRPENIRLDWLGNFLAFQDTPLHDVAREIERQFKVRIEIMDASLASRTITGWFAGWPLERIVDVICTVADAQCTSAKDVVTIRPRPSRNP